MWVRSRRSDLAAAGVNIQSGEEVAIKLVCDNLILFVDLFLLEACMALGNSSSRMQTYR